MVVLFDPTDRLWRRVERWRKHVEWSGGDNDCACVYAGYGGRDTRVNCGFAGDHTHTNDTQYNERRDADQPTRSNGYRTRAGNGAGDRAGTCGCAANAAGCDSSDDPGQLSSHSVHRSEFGGRRIILAGDINQPALR